MTYKSRTGRLRTSIGQAKKLLSDRCTTGRGDIPADVSALDLDGLSDAKIKLNTDVEHITKSLKRLQELDKEWDGEMKSLNDADYTEEEKLYNAAAKDDVTSSPQVLGFHSVLLNAETLLDGIDRCLRKIDAEIQSQNPTAAPANVGHNADMAAALKLLADSLQKNGSCNLPKLDLPVLSGKLEEATGFWQAFDVHVGSKKITDAEKLTYLMKYVVGEAKAAVCNYSINDANYKHVVDTLKKRFGDPQETKDVRKVIEQFEAICRQLEDLGEDTNTTEFAVALRSRIPFWIQEKVQEAEDNDPNFDTVKCRARVLRAWKNREDAKKNQQPDPKPAVVAPFNQQNVQKKKSPKNNAAPQNNVAVKQPCKCDFCGGGHYSTQCHVYSTFEARRKCIEDNRLCFLCLKKGHRSIDCRRKRYIRCSESCGGRHNPAVCSKELPHESAAPFGVTLPVTVPPPPAPASLPAAAVEVKETNCATNESPPLKERLTGLLLSRHVVIANPNDHAKSVKALVMFDSGGSCSFIKSSLAQELQLQPYDTTTLLVNRFGEENGKVEIPSNTFSVRLMLKNGGHLDVNTHSTEKILDPIWSAAVESKAKNVIRDPTKIKFTRAEPLILIGIDYFFKLIKLSNSFTVGELTWIESLVGAMICGKATIRNDAAHAMLPVVASLVTDCVEPAAENIEAEYIAATVTPGDIFDDFQNPFAYDISATHKRSIVIAIANNDDEKIERFFKLEDMKIYDDYAEDETFKAKIHFDETVYKIGHRYVVSWPFHD